MRVWGIAALALATVGCFSPALESELRCSDGLCPQGFRCDDGLCVDTSPGADAGVDGRVGDGPCYGEQATRVVPGMVYTGNTEENGFDNADGCNARGVEDYYELVLSQADVPANVTFDALMTDYDLVLRVRQGTCEMSAEFVCEDTDNMDGDIVTRSITVPGSYFILIDTHGDDRGGSYELVVTVEPE